ncbi:MAG TPA: hypothetical protein VF384_04975 [Planctomycetota bacterium]
MPTLFVLLPEDSDLDRLLADAPATLQALRGSLRSRVYPRATDGPHLLSLVRAGRDPVATRWIGGMVLAVVAGAVIGAVVNGVLAGAFGMFSGLLEIAIPLGFVLGAFLGGFTATMTGTEVAVAAVRHLSQHVRSGDVLVQCLAQERAALEALSAFLAARGVHCAHGD